MRSRKYSGKDIVCCSKQGLQKYDWWAPEQLKIFLTSCLLRQLGPYRPISSPVLKQFLHLVNILNFELYIFIILIEWFINYCQQSFVNLGEKIMANTVRFTRGRRLLRTFIQKLRRIISPKPAQANTRL
jgi:hypothetical protein